MRILDINNVELQEKDVDLSIGYLVEEKLFIKHHEAIEYKERQYHYWPKKYCFEDGSLYTVQENDPHVRVNNLERTSFGWNALEGERERVVQGIEFKVVEDSPAVDAKEAWDEYEDILRYRLYTQEELDEIKAKKEKEEKQKNFINNGPDILENNSAQIDNINSTMEDVILLLAEIAGGSDE